MAGKPNWHREIRYPGGVKELVSDPWGGVLCAIYLGLFLAYSLTQNLILLLMIGVLGLGLMALVLFEGDLAQYWNRRHKPKG